jgi:hypothetical protein
MMSKFFLKINRSDVVAEGPSVAEHPVTKRLIDRIAYETQTGPLCADAIRMHVLDMNFSHLTVRLTRKLRN